jgi:DNA ligase (NAD+)
MEKYLDQLSEMYYKGQPEVTDEEFDRLAQKHSYNAVGAKDGETPHLYRMYSLQKVHFGEKQPKLVNPVTTPKLDGAAISVSYVGNEFKHLHQVITRGDGVQGQDITNKIRHLVPETFFGGTSTLQFNCEVVAPKTISNSRNYASGALNLKDVNEVKQRDITVVCYDVLGTSLETYKERLEFAKQCGFNVITDNVDRFPNDGQVVREDDCLLYEKMGYTSKHPRAAYALKPKPQTVVTKLLDVEWNVGRSGIVSPVAILEPVVIGEATVSRATLHNMDYIDSLGLEIGCDVVVVRSGEIIPRILGRADELQ